MANEDQNRRVARPHAPFPSIPHIILAAVLSGWVFLILLAPLLEPPGTVQFDDRGVVGFIDYDERTDTMNPLSRTIYRIGDRMCHLKASRSLTIRGNQFPFCARCFAIFLGMALGAILTNFRYIELKVWMIVGGLLPIALDGGIQAISTYESTNALRLVTGGLAGGMTAVAMGMIIWEICAIRYERQHRFGDGAGESDGNDSDL